MITVYCQYLWILPVYLLGIHLPTALHFNNHIIDERAIFFIVMHDAPIKATVERQ